MLWRRAASVLLAGMLTWGALPLSLNAADASGFGSARIGYTDTLTTSYDPNNYITFSIDRNTLTFEGILTRDGLDQIMFQLQDESGELIGSKVTFDISSGVRFSAQIRLADIPELPDSFYAEIYTSTTPDRSDDLWNNHGKSVLISKINGEYMIMISPAFDCNSEFFDAWINPGASFDAAVSDNLRKLAERICSGARGDYEKVGAIYRWVVENIHYDCDYVNGKKNSTATSVMEVYTDRYALPAGFCNILEALLEAAGIPTVITSGHTTNMTELLAETEYKYTSTAVEAFADGRWIVMLPYRETAKKYENGEYSDWIGRAYRGFDISHEFLATFFKVSSRACADENDIPSEWSKDDIAASVKAGIAPNDLQHGYSEAITREEFCRLIMSMLTKKKGASDVMELLSGFSIEYSDCFADTDSAEVNGAYLLGIVSGRGGDCFDPNGEITRQEAAVIIAGASELLGVSASGVSSTVFVDMESCADWARGAVETVTRIVSENGDALMGGIDASHFGPLSVYTREQAFVTVYRLYTCK